MRAHAISLLTVVVGCSAPDATGVRSGRDEALVERHATRHGPADAAPAPVPVERPAMVRFHMARHFDDLGRIERLLVAGKLDEAKTLAFLLTRPASDPALERWNGESASVAEAATALSNASTLEQACRLEPRVAQACAGCHLNATHLPIFAAAAPAPPDRPTVGARMARHQWAVDRLWEGTIGADDQPWRAGLEVLATTPLPFSPPGDSSRFALQLQQLARGALAAQPTNTLEQRSVEYGDILVTCAKCHAANH